MIIIKIFIIYYYNLELVMKNKNKRNSTPLEINQVLSLVRSPSMPTHVPRTAYYVGSPTGPLGLLLRTEHVVQWPLSADNSLRMARYGEISIDN